VVFLPNTDLKNTVILVKYRRNISCNDLRIPGKKEAGSSGIKD
jgi:hypothetical protein